MPTGYTADIVDGKISTFKEFAMICIRAFGASIHMRDEPLSKSYQPETVDNYYIERVARLQNDLAVLINTSDEDLINDERAKLLKSIDECENKIQRIKNTAITLNSILSDVLLWSPPTPEHQGFKNFMIEQLRETIKHDANPDFYIELKEESTRRLRELNVNVIRNEKFTAIMESINSATESLEKQQKRVESSNKWVDDLMNSL